MAIAIRPSRRQWWGPSSQPRLGWARTGTESEPGFAGHNESGEGRYSDRTRDMAVTWYRPMSRGAYVRCAVGMNNVHTKQAYLWPDQPVTVCSVRNEVIVRLFGRGAQSDSASHPAPNGPVERKFVPIERNSFPNLTNLSNYEKPSPKTNKAIFFWAPEEINI